MHPRNGAQYAREWKKGWKNGHVIITFYQGKIKDGCNTNEINGRAGSLTYYRTAASRKSHASEWLETENQEWVKLTFSPYTARKPGKRRVRRAIIIQ